MGLGYPQNHRMTIVISFVEDINTPDDISAHGGEAGPVMNDLGQTVSVKTTAFPDLCRYFIDNGPRRRRWQRRREGRRRGSDGVLATSMSALGHEEASFFYYYHFLLVLCFFFSSFFLFLKGFFFSFLN